MRKPKMNKIIISLLLASFALTSTALGSTNGLGSQCRTGMFTDDTFSEQTDLINIHERVFLLVNCKSLPEGSYTISTQWMDEEGKLHTERPHSFKVASQQDYSAAFKFKQMPKGMLKTMSSGQDFEEHQYGKWSVMTFINTDEINRNYFTITD